MCEIHVITEMIVTWCLHSFSVISFIDNNLNGIHFPLVVNEPHPISTRWQAANQSNSREYPGEFWVGGPMTFLIFFMGNGQLHATPLREECQSQIEASWRSIFVGEAQFLGGEERTEKMAYHNQYRPPHYNSAPPDQGFLWNIFQRWVEARTLSWFRMRNYSFNCSYVP